MRVLRLLAVSILLIQSAFAGESSGFPDQVTGFRDLLWNGSSMAIKAERARITAWLADKRIVFISGMMDDVIPGVFQDNMAVLRKDFGFQSITLIKPLSSHTVAENALELAPQIDQLARKNPTQKLILIAASKGGAETILMLLENPTWLASGKIHRVVGIQPAVNGTPLADIATAKCTDDHDSLICQLFADSPYAREGLASLKTDRVAQEIQPRLARLSDDERSSFTHRLFYVRASQRSLFRVSLEFKIPWLLNLDHGGENDGMLLTAQEKLPNLGTDLGVLQSDHAGLFGAPAFSNESYAFRQGFMWALLERLIQSE